MSDLLRDEYVAALEAENDGLRAQLRDLEKSFGFYNDVPIMFGLTGSEAKVLSLLGERDMANRDQFLSALMVGRGADAEPEKKIVDVYICKIRSKLKPFGITIEAIWGRGYRLTEANKAKIAEYLTARTEAAE
jgi:two-component system, cell cycle response regulator CtrA